jgi:ribonuclease P/MRP protein subunit POP8
MDIDEAESGQPPSTHDSSSTTNPGDTTTTSTITPTTPLHKGGFEIASTTITSPPWSYVHLEMITDGSILQPRTTGSQTSTPLDALQVRSYCTAALRQFLGDHGAGIPMDILKVSGQACWARVPRPDLGAFAAALTAYGGATQHNGERSVLQLRASGNFLGSLIGRADDQCL